MNHSKFTTVGGQVRFRTAPMPTARAESFARCLSANNRFAKAETVRSRRDGFAAVAFVPAAEARQESVFLIYQQEQIDRAAEEGASYEFRAVTGGGVLVTTLPDERGQRDTYRVAVDLSCECPHFQYRLAGSGVMCKHVIAAIAAGELIVPVPGRPAPSAQSASSAADDLDFLLDDSLRNPTPLPVEQQTKIIGFPVSTSRRTIGRDEFAMDWL